MSTHKSSFYKTYHQKAIKLNQLDSDEEQAAVESEKNRRVNTDRKPTFGPNIKSEVNKANFILWVTRKTFQVIALQTLLQPNKALILLHPEYANEVWCPLVKKHVTLMGNLQRPASGLGVEIRRKIYQDRLKLQSANVKLSKKRGKIKQIYKILREKYAAEATTGLYGTNCRDVRRK